MNDSTNNETERSSKWGMTTALSAAVAASACCTIPLLLVALGIGGGWMGSLTALEPYRPIFVSIALLALGYAGYRELQSMRRRKRGIDCDCEEEAVSPRTRQIVLLVGAIAVLALVASPWIIRAFNPPAVIAEPFAVTAATLISTSEVVLDVEGMTCASCHVTVQRALLNVDGVADAEVSLEPPRAVVTYDPAQVTVEQLTTATANAGYPSRLATEVGT